MPNPTISAGYPKALLDFAVSRGADRQVLIEQSHIRLEDLKDQDNRIPLANYMALLKAGIELCKEPALSLLFGEAVRLQDISLVGLMAVINKKKNARQPKVRHRRAEVVLASGLGPEPLRNMREWIVG